MISPIIAHADLVVVPVVPSPHDIWAIGNTIGVIEDTGVPLVFVVNNAGGAKLTAQTVKQLRARPGITASSLGRSTLF